MKKRYIFAIIGVLLLIIVFPIMMHSLIFANIHQVTNSNTWAGFLGEYVGSLIGALVSLLGIFITIRFTAKENKKDRELQIAPFPSISFESTEKLTRTKYYFDNILYSEEKNSPLNIFGTVHIKNIGVGPLLNCYLTDVEYNEKPFPRAELILRNNALASGQQWDIMIGLSIKLGQIPDDLLVNNTTLGIIPSPDSLKNKGGKLKFTINFCNCMNKPDHRTVTLCIYVGTESQNSQWHYTGEIYMESVT